MKIALWIAIAFNAFALYIIVLQDDVIEQNRYDLNVSQTAFMMQSHMVKTKGLCSPRSEMR